MVGNRGRKREPWEKYKKDAEVKIADLRAKLACAKRDKMPVKERMKLRNQISAQQSRLKKKMEVFHLHKLIKDKDDKINDFARMFSKFLGDDHQVIPKFTEYMDSNW